MLKLNIGCGRKYQKEYVNIDLFDNTVADIVAESWKLPYKSNSVSKILAEQLIEHLGYVASKFTLAEFYRVLKVNGQLILSTPDIVKTSKAILNNNKKLINNSINWLYGMEHNGYVHKLCFTKKLLVSELENIGFIVRHFEEYNFEKNPFFPAIRVIVSKSKINLKTCMLRAGFRNRIIECGIVDLRSVHLLQSGLENLIEDFHDIILENEENILSFIKRMWIYNPILVLAFLKLTVIQSSLSKTLFSKIKMITDKLINNKFMWQLYTYKSNNYLDVEKVMIKADKYLESLIKTAEKDILKRGKFSVLSSDLKYLEKEKKVYAFDSMNVRDLSEFYVARGIKHMIQRNIKLAEKLFKIAFSFDVNNKLLLWNLARLQTIKGNIPLALIFYSKVLRITSKSKHNLIIKEIENVSKNNDIENYKEVITYEDI